MEGAPLIAIFCSSFPPEGGGASGRIYNMAVLLRDAGYRVQVVCAMPNYPTGRIFPAYRGRLVCHEVIDGIAVRRVWISPSNGTAAAARGRSMVSFVLSLRLFAHRLVLRQQPALVIVSSPPLLVAADAVRYFSRRGIKVLLNVSDIWPLSATSLGAVARGSMLTRLLERLARGMYRSAAVVMAQSEATLEHIRQVAGVGKSMMLYRNLPGPLAVPVDVAGSPPLPLRLIYPGLLGHAQGILALITAVDFTALDASLHIYGEGGEYAAIQSWIKAHPDRDVYLHRPVPAPGLTLLLCGFHAMLVPLVTPIEGALPSKLFTAIQAGLPVLCCAGGEAERLVIQHNLGWTTAPGDYTALAQQIRELTRLDAEAYKAIRCNILEKAAAIFDKEEQDIHFIQFIRALI